MRRILILSLSFGILNSLAAQTMQASIGVGASPTAVKIYMKPSGVVNGQLSTLNFNIAIPEVTPGPIPTLTISNNPFPTAGFQILPAYTESGYLHYNIANLNPFNVNIGAGIETEVLEVKFNGNPENTALVSLVTLPDGGVNTPFALFLCTGAAGTNGSGLYYTRPGTTVSNQFSYTFPSFTPAGTSISTANLSSLITLPVTWLSFDAVKQGNDAKLNWKVANEESNLRYELQRSVNGTDFFPIATINKVGTGGGTKEYNHTDRGIDGLSAVALYYRVKQIDIDGRSTFSETRIIKLGKGSGGITVFPNPVKDGFYINVPLTNTDRGTLKLNLLTLSGQLAIAREITSQQASNYYFDIKGAGLSAGQYSLQIIQEGNVLAIKKLIVSK